MHRLIFLVLFALAVSLTAEEFIDFEKQMASSFVLETKKIEIPGFPDAFNPSIVPFKGSFLMSFRTRDPGSVNMSGESGDDYVEQADSFLMSFRFRDPSNPDCQFDVVSQKTGANCKNLFGLVLLNQHFEPISWPQILNIRYTSPQVLAWQQDPRLLYVGNKIMIAFSNMILGLDGKKLRRMFVSEIVSRNDNGMYTFSTTEPVLIDSYEGQGEQDITKNWVPFEYEGGLNLAYNINPHTVFRFDGTNHAQTLGNTSITTTWDYGALRGGTPALLDDDGQYLAFFHTSKEMKSAHSKGKKIQHYFMGAYTFSNQAPFSLTSISKEPIVGPGFYSGKDDYKTWKPLRVVFPGGIVFSEDKIFVAYGRQDYEVWIATLDKKGLRESLVPVH